MSTDWKQGRVTFDEAYRKLSERGELKAVAGRNYRAICPVCNKDKLYIKEKQDGGVLLYCHTGCDFFEIILAIKSEWTIE